MSDIEKIKKRMVEQDREARRLVSTFFYDSKKVDLWMGADNPLLGGVSPVQMIRWGRGDTLIKFIKTSLAENKRD